MKVTTKSGFKCNINERVLDDWRFTRAIGRTHSDDQYERLNAAADMVSLIMRDNEEAFYKHLDKKGDGIVSEEAVVEDIQSIIEQIKAIKNS